MASTQLFMDRQDDFILRMEQEYQASLSPDTTYDFLSDDGATVDLESQSFMVESRVATSMAAEATEAEVASLLIGEELTSVEQFEVDAATEFMWALAAVIGCFSMVLVPSFTVYFAARAKQKKLEVKLESAKEALEEE